MVTIKEFIKENSPNVPKKKKKRVRFKNFNPFRKRKYKRLDEEHKDWSRQHPHTSPSDGDHHKSSHSEPKDFQNTENPAQKRRRPKERFHAACVSLGLGKGNPDDPDAEGRRQARKHGSTECLIDEETADNVLVPDAGDVRTEPKSTHALSDSPGRSSEKENPGSGVKRVVISEEIEVIDAEEEAPAKIKKKKSKKKKLKKAGIKTVQMLGHGFTTMAITYQFMTPDAAIAPVAKEMAKRREDRYMELSSLAYVMMVT